MRTEVIPDHSFAELTERLGSRIRLVIIVNSVTNQSVTGIETDSGTVISSSADKTLNERNQ